MDPKIRDRIKNDPNYKALASERLSFGWTLAGVALVLYFGFIALVAFSPDTMGIKVAGTITVGIVLGVFVIRAAIFLTGIYVMRGNARRGKETEVTSGRAWPRAAFIAAKAKQRSEKRCIAPTVISRANYSKFSREPLRVPQGTRFDRVVYFVTVLQPA